ncbi:cytochrome P450 [soil metagenome]
MAIVDISDPDLYVEGVPHERFRRLRREEPVSWHPAVDGAGHWALVRHSDVVAAGKDWRTFSSARGSTLEELDDEQLAVRRSMLDLDPPAHTRLRRLIGPSFTPKVIRAYEEAIRLMTRQVVDEAVAKGSFDLVEEISKPVPVLWLCEHMGMAQADANLLIELTDRMLGQDDPEYRESVDPEVVRLAPFGTMAGLESYRYAAGLAAERRARPRDDVLTRILFAEPGGEPLTDEEFQNFFSVLMIAGQEASRHSVSHGTVLLLEHPQALSDLLGDPAGLMESATEEIIRWATPIYQFRRTATTDVSLHGTSIRAGDKVTLWYISANFDETVVSDPHTFDIRRHPNDHVSFGRGPHLCLGAALARLQVRITFEELLPHLAHMQISGPVERLRSNFIHGIKHLPVEIG